LSQKWAFGRAIDLLACLRELELIDVASDDEKERAPGQKADRRVCAGQSSSMRSEIGGEEPAR